MTSYSAAVAAHMLAHQERYLEKKRREYDLALGTAIAPILIDMVLPSVLKALRLSNDGRVQYNLAYDNEETQSAMERWLHKHIVGKWEYAVMSSLRFENFDDAALFYLRFK